MAESAALGKTVKLKYTMQQCASDRPSWVAGSCQEPLDISLNVFVSTKGHVFDFSTSDTGDEYDLGIPSNGTTVNAVDDLLTFSKGDFVWSIAIKSDTCRVSITRTGGVTVNVLSQSCSVVEGPSPR